MRGRSARSLSRLAPCRIERAATWKRRFYYSARPATLRSACCCRRCSALDADGLLPAELRIVGTARSQLDAAAYRAIAAAGAGRRISTPSGCARRPVDALPRPPELCRARRDRSERLRRAAPPPSGADRACRSSCRPRRRCSARRSPAWRGGAGRRSTSASRSKSRSAHDLASARAINDAVAAAFPEERTFRIDHYLGKETVQNLLALRFGNALFEPLWNAGGIDHVQITIAETVGLEGRAGYYDGMGALRDMVQNHMLQLVALVAMEPPARFDATSVRDEKVKVLRSLRPIDADDGRGVQRHRPVRRRRDRRAAGRRAMPTNSAGRRRPRPSSRSRRMSTTGAGRACPSTCAPASGCRARQSEITIQFKAVPHSIFGARAAPLRPNRLSSGCSRDENIRLLMMAKEPGLDRDGMRLREVPLDLGLANAFADVRRRIAYERLLLDLIEGDQTLFVRRDEVEAQWTWIDAIRAGWAATDMKPKTLWRGHLGSVGGDRADRARRRELA